MPSSPSLTTSRGITTIQAEQMPHVMHARCSMEVPTAPPFLRSSLDTAGTPHVVIWSFFMIVCDISTSILWSWLRQVRIGCPSPGLGWMLPTASTYLPAVLPRPATGLEGKVSVSGDKGSMD